MVVQQVQHVLCAGERREKQASWGRERGLHKRGVLARQGQALRGNAAQGAGWQQAGRRHGQTRTAPVTPAPTTLLWRTMSHAAKPLAPPGCSACRSSPLHTPQRPPDLTARTWHESRRSLHSLLLPHDSFCIVESVRFTKISNALSGCAVIVATGATRLARYSGEAHTYALLSYYTVC